MKVKADRDEASPYAAMLAAQVMNDFHATMNLGFSSSAILISILLVGCRGKMQNAGHHCFTHQVTRHWRKQDKNPRTRSSICVESVSSVRHADWSHRRCNTNSFGRHPKKRWSTWTSVVVLAIFFFFLYVRIILRLELCVLR